MLLLVLLLLAWLLLVWLLLTAWLLLTMVLLLLLLLLLRHTSGFIATMLLLRLAISMLQMAERGGGGIKLCRELLKMRVGLLNGAGRVLERVLQLRLPGQHLAQLILPVPPEAHGLCFLLLQAAHGHEVHARLRPHSCARVQRQWPALASRV